MYWHSLTWIIKGVLEKIGIFATISYGVVKVKVVGFLGPDGSP